MPIAVTCKVCPATTDGFAGVTTIEVKVGGIAVTVNVLVPVTPCDFAVMVVTPGDLQVATPPLPIIATLVLEEPHFADAVRS